MGAREKGFRRYEPFYLTIRRSEALRDHFLVCGTERRTRDEGETAQRVKERRRVKVKE